MWCDLLRAATLDRNMEGYKVIPLISYEGEEQSGLEQVNSLLASALFEDPQFKEIFPDDSQRRYQLSYLFERLVWLKIWNEGGFSFVMVSETNKVVGCIFLTPFESPASFWQKVQVGMLVAPLFIGWRNFQTMMNISSTNDNLKHQYFQETGENQSDYFLVSHVAIAPELQGKGLGKMLVNFVGDHSRSKGRSLILGTATLGNVEFYKKCGFKHEKTQSIEGREGTPVYYYVMTRKM
eukprot:TRINITY_DN1629_c0_g1_i6.p1 TRINITY_DN1629_c0_g1~~TRINITY_DN1629_c0_g1_i6.p1  ORF type:complete len:237 (-),score=36.43 TRINITY_DN1629_c0_g1_i6:80-790(-)